MTENVSSGARVDADVVVVGAGPVGLALAVLVAQSGHSVIVLERWPSPYPLPRAVHFDHEVGRILQSCGIGSELRDVSEPADIYEWRNADGDTLLKFGRVGDGASGWPESSMFCQPELEALLESRAAQLPGVDLRRGVEIVGLDQSDEHVELRDAEGGVVRARYAVGCDGANSTVRGLAGLEVRDLGFFYDWLIVDVILDEPRVFRPLNLQICDPVRPTTVVSGGPGRRRWEFMRLPDERLDDLNDADRAWALLAPWNVSPANARLERHAVYTFQARYAEQWRAGRVLIAGDAAHQMPPFAGQGMCAGIRDAANLAWKLGAVLDGTAHTSLLDTYAEERLPSAQAAIELSMALGKVICVADPAEARARDEAMSAMVRADPIDVPALPGVGAGIVHPTSPHAGGLFVQVRVDGIPFDDLHGVGWRLISMAPVPCDIDAATLGWFESIGGRQVRIDEPDPTFVRWSAGHDATIVLQRPDFHIYGTATDGDAAADLLAHLRARLMTGTPSDTRHRGDPT